MLALSVIFNFFKVMLIFNCLNATVSRAETDSFTTISSTTNLTPSSATSSGNSEVAFGSLVVGFDNLNIRHERSKQRRHPSSNIDKEQSHVSRNLYEATSEMQQLHRPLQTINSAIEDNTLKAKIIVATTTTKKIGGVDEIVATPHNNASDFASIGLVSLTAADGSENSTRHAKNIKKAIAVVNNNISSSNSIQSLLLPTITSIHYFTAAGSVPTTTLQTVTHKIRKLHKKKLVESLRQLNIDKFNSNGGHLTKNHHRSLVEAEQLQQQAQMKSATNIVTAASTEQQKQLKQERQRYQNQETQQQWQWLAKTTVATAQQTEGMMKEMGTTVATNDIDRNESVNENYLPDMLDVDEDDVDVDNNDDDDDDADGDGDGDKPPDNDDLMDVLYQNDENVLSDEYVANAGNDELLATTLNSLILQDDKSGKKFKNYSSEFMREIDNNVDLEAGENETKHISNQTWKQIKNFPGKLHNFQNYSSVVDEINATYETDNTSYSSLPILSTEFSGETQSYEPSSAASTSQQNINFEARHSFLYDKEEINFNDALDFNQDYSSSSKDLIVDDAAEPKKFNANDFSLSGADTEESDAETEVILEIGGDDDETNNFLEGVVDAANSEEIYDWDEISRSNRRDLMHGRDVVTKFLQIVETQHSLGSNCEAGTSLNLGEGVVDRYAQDRFRVEAEVAVNRANMLTRIFKMTSSAAQADVNLLHASVLSMVEFDDDIFAAGNCFDWNEHPSQPGLFCPFAYRLPPPNLGAILAKDLAMEYHYLGNTSEWFFQARKNAEKVIARNEQYLKAFHLYSNRTDERIEDDTLAVKYEDGRWSKPYYDCGGGNIWMLTYTVPFFGYENSTYHFKGTSGIDIDLRRVDIDQCPQRNIPGSTKPLNIFAGTDKCKQRTTMCEALQGLGFRRGSYKCVCRKGYYFPDTTSQHKYFNGSLLEEEYEKLMLGKNSTYNIVNEYECLPCAEGCDSCEDGSPCIAALNWPMRTSILALACIVIGLLPPAAWFTFRYQQVKVVRAASPALLRVIALGAFFIYCTNIVMYPNPNLYTCTARIWLREIGFSLTYGALMLKTWRISVIFRVRSAKAVKITDAALLKRLGCICGAIGTCLLVRTLVSPPDVVVGRTADDLKAFLCKTDWWDYTFTSMEVVFLAWGVRLCIMVRKAPSEFNESRFISMAIYNEFLLTCFLNVSMLFLQSPANPDLLYIIFFCHTQLTITLLLALIFGSKVYIVLRSGKSHQENIGLGAKSSGAKFNFRPQVRTFANPSSVTTSTVPVVATTSAENKLSDQEALEEIRQLSVQLQRIQEMAPPKGVAVMTISSLLDGLKTPGSMVMVAAAASTGGIGSGGNQLTVHSQKAEALPLLSLNSNMQNYQQLHIPTTTNNNVAAIKSIPAITMPSAQGTVTASTPTQAAANKIGHWDEKSVNTDIIGNCIAEKELKQQQQQQQHIICQRCYEKCKDQYHYQQLPKTRNETTSAALSVNSPAKLNKCQLLGSPQPEGSISFKNIKLDCMCSQSDDLDKPTEQEQLHQKTTTRRITKRSAATNTPPCTARKRNQLPSNVNVTKTQSTISLPSGESRSGLASTTTKPISYISKKKSQVQQVQHQKQQICDNCKNKFKRYPSSDSRIQKISKKSEHQHNKLSKLNRKCNKLIEDVEKSKYKTTVASVVISKPTTTIHTTPAKGQRDYDDDIRYSTDDIIFYTTTDTSEDSDDDSDDDDSNEEHDSSADSDKSENLDVHVKITKEDDLSSSLSQSKSETRVPLKLTSHTASIELKCISLSLGNITTTGSLTLTTVTTSSTSASTTSKPESLKSTKALLDSNAIQTIADATTQVATVSSTSQQQSQPSELSSNDNSNGKAKRPDKLVLNLNDRSKFTKEVSV